MNIRQAHKDVLNPKRMTLDGLPCVYRRGDLSVSLTVTRGKSLMNLSTTMGGQRVELWDADWFVTAADLILDGRRVDPLSGDRLDVTIDDEIIRFEALPPSKEEPAARKVDSDVAWRIHTKRIKPVVGF